MFEMKPYERKNHSVAGFDPFGNMEEFEKKFFANPFGLMAGGFEGFRTDITDNGGSYELEADLPGFKKEDIKLNINGDTLTVSAHRDEKSEDKKGDYIRRERSYGSYTRSYDISAVKADEIKAKYEDGVLKLTLPKKEPSEPQPREIEIE